MDIISRLSCWKYPKSECPDIWIRLPRHKWPKSWSSMEDPVVFLWAKSVRSSFDMTVMGQAIWENPIETWLGENSKLGMSLCSSCKRMILICECGWHEIGWKETKSWKLLNKEVDLGEPTSFLDHVYLGCTQRQCEISKNIVDNYWTMFESRISAGGVEKLPFPQNLRISSWSHDMTGNAKTCVERYCELANKTTQQLYKVSTPCIDDHHFKEEETKYVGELSKNRWNCSEIRALGTYWKTWYSMVNEQICTIDHEMEQSLWQTSESIDFLHPLHMWI